MIPILDRLRACSGCRHRAEGECRLAERRTADLAKMPRWGCPLIAGADEPRNLMFHCLPVGHWKWHVARLARADRLFTGRRIVAVTPDPDSPDAAGAVRHEFQELGVRVDDWIVAPNDPDLGESITFPRMLDAVRQHPGVSFYCHTKGVTRNTLEVRAWTHAMFGTLLDQFEDRVAGPLGSACCVGSFRRIGRLLPVTSPWHYSGTFFWFRHDRLPPPSFVFDHRHAVESWPGTLWSLAESACVYADRCDCLYQPSTWERLPQWDS